MTDREIHFVLADVVFDILEYGYVAVKVFVLCSGER